jgi:hypothetical protein
MFYTRKLQLQQDKLACNKWPLGGNAWGSFNDNTIDNL